MPWELIYTSTPRGLVTGQSGFCTVARTKDMREGLIQRLERMSSYHYLDHGVGTARIRNPVISACRMLNLGNTRFYVLSRILPCGLDFTSRTNHLAHHLAFGVEELGQIPSPAVVLEHWGGWRSSWPGAPKLLDPLNPSSFATLPVASLPAREWQKATQDAGRAAGLFEGEFSRGCNLLVPAGGEELLLRLFGESLQLLNPDGRSPQKAWQFTFTNFLQGEDVATDFNWRGCQPGTPAYEMAVRNQARLIPVEKIQAPENELARLAREGPRIVLPERPQLMLAAGTGSSRPLTIRKPHAPAKRTAPAQPEGLTISISLKSILGALIAVILLLGLWEAKHLWLNKRMVNATPIPVGPTNAVTKTPATNKPDEMASGSDKAPLATPEAEPSYSPSEAKHELEGKLSSVPTYLFTIDTFSGTNVPLTGVMPLAKLLQEFSRIDIRPTDVDLNVNFNSWNPVTAGSRWKLESDRGSRRLAATGNLENQSAGEISIDYSGLGGRPESGEPVYLQVSLNSPPDTGIYSLSLLFRPHHAGSSDEKPSFKPFRVLIVNENEPPPPVRLSERFLRENAGRGEWFIETLQERLGQFHKGDALTWQLRPYVIVTDAGGTNSARDLYEAFPNAQPDPGYELDFGEARKALELRLNRQAADLNQIEEQIKRSQSIVPAPFDTNLQAGVSLGVTNAELRSFSSFLATAHRREPGSSLFLRYLRKLVKSAAPQQTWLGSWPGAEETEWDNPRWESANLNYIFGQLQTLANLCSTNLPSPGVMGGDSVGNYFVNGLQDLMGQDALTVLAADRETAEANVQRAKNDLASLPNRLEQLAYVRLFLASTTNPTKRMEFIRFTRESPAHP